ncbi:MAG: putative Ig domain-containing protein, partial [Pseudomonadota bacterium]
VVVTTISDTSTAEDAAFSSNLAGNFTDDDLTHGDSLTFSATQSNGAPIPAWLSMDPTTGVLSGTPTNDDVGVITLTVIATDDTGVSTATNFQLTVDNINDQPVVVTPIADAAPSEDAPFTYDVSGNFRDDDTVHGDSLTFSAEQSGGTPLPGWLSIDPATGILSGTPDSSQAGIPYTIEVTATDASGANITSTFQLTVDNVNDAPVLDVTATPTMTAVAANATDPAGDTIA